MTHADFSAPDKTPLVSLVFLEANADLIQMLLNSTAADQLINKTVEFALEEGRLTFQSDLIPDELMAHHFASSMISLFRWWLDNGMQLPKEEMAAHINLLIIRPMKQLSGIK